MTNLVATGITIPRLTDESIDKITRLEQALRELEHEPVTTEHIIHGGMYARTICLKAGVVLVGVLIEVPTILIVNGHIEMHIGEDNIIVDGYKVIPASKRRKQCMITLSDTFLTMVLATSCSTINDVENEFTKDADSLASRLPTAENLIIITGE